MEQALSGTNLANEIYDQVLLLPSTLQQQILDFTLFLSQRRGLDSVMDNIIDENHEAFEELAK